MFRQHLLTFLRTDTDPDSSTVQIVCPKIFFSLCVEFVAEYPDCTNLLDILATDERKEVVDLRKKMNIHTEDIKTHQETLRTTLNECGLALTDFDPTLARLLFAPNACSSFVEMMVQAKRRAPARYHLMEQEMTRVCGSYDPLREPLDMKCAAVVYSQDQYNHSGFVYQHETTFLILEVPYHDDPNIRKRRHPRFLDGNTVRIPCGYCFIF